ncbi:fimbrillin family protein, partial [uncultured Bacteroides sp.]|uniref:fimbrillin family protein n=1 Tax=uncultured Bacteroides sp. TaxID=162156 RepID=UPI0025FB2384
ITLTAMLAALTGCSADNDPQIAAGEDGTSVTFGATIDHREAHGNDKAPASRAITDGTFDDYDRIFVHMDGKLKAFVYRTGQGFVHDGNASGTNIDPTPAEWEAGETQKDVLAYGPPSMIVYDDNSGYYYQCMAAKDQSSDDNYKNSDYVYAAQTLHRSRPALTFRHGMARIVVRLRPGGSLKDEDVEGATVLLGNENLLIIADIHPQTGTLTAHVPTENGELPPQTITPHRCADTPTGFVAAYEALLPPQDVSGKAFIRVRLPNGKEREYVAESGSLLEGGHEYVYNATVEEDRVTVTISDSDVPWQDGILTTNINGKEFRLIRTAEDLARFADDVNSGQRDLNALQTADIDLSGIDNWKPIGMQYPGELRPFTGIYNGNGYTISNLKISNMQEGSAAGLFGVTDGGALLTGIHLRKVEIISGRAINVGTLVGWNGSASTVSLCSAQGKINTSEYDPTVGGLAGINNGTITRCRTDVKIKADRIRLLGQLSADAGGITGRNSGGLLFACHAIGSVTMEVNTSEGNTIRAGGIAGWNINNSNSIIYCCIAEGDVSVTSETADINIYAGGLVGYHYGHKGGLLNSCYASGTATASTIEAKVGAIVGFMDGGNVDCCYGAGVGGKGTSNCGDAARLICNINPGKGDILQLMNRSYSAPGTITRYDPDATPAYGIDIYRSGSVYSSSFWLAGDGTWPVLDFTRNTLN